MDQQARPDWRSREARATRARLKGMQANPSQALRALEAKARRIQDEGEAILRAEDAVWLERFALAVSWLAKEHSDKTAGGAPHLEMVLRGDSYSLAEFEGYGIAGGRHGDAVLLTEQDFGQVWWLQQQGANATPTFALTRGPCTFIACEVRFVAQA